MDVEHMCVASQMQAGIRIAGTAEFAGIEADADNRRAFIFKKALKNLGLNVTIENTQDVTLSGLKQACIDRYYP